MKGADELALDRVERFMAEHVAGFRGPLAAERFAGGQSNPTYRLSAASGDYVLRRKPPGPLLPSAHAVDREFRVMRALGQTAVRFTSWSISTAASSGTSGSLASRLTNGMRCSCR
jgi:aminoglycoside phosphotransferase (APT) family kinase protein